MIPRALNFVCLAFVALLASCAGTRAEAAEPPPGSSRAADRHFLREPAPVEELPKASPIRLVAQPRDGGVSQDDDLFPGLAPDPQTERAEEGQAPPAGSAGNSDDGACTPEKLKALKKAAAGAYRDPFFDNDFSYLNDPCYSGHLLGERFKQWRVPLFHECTTLDLGGQYRLRFQDEINMRGLGLTGLDDQFLLRRLRLYADWTLSENFRVYSEYLGANSDFEDFLPRAIENNPHEIQNLFLDMRLLATDEGDWWARAGRQELLYGSQRLLSPLDWANTRRTFDGGKIYYHEKDWDLDGFWVRPIYAEPQSLDSPEGTQELYALWWAYRGVP